MINFKNDYGELCTPEILAKLQEISNTSYVGYGLDEVCESAKEKMRKYLEDDNCDIHFVSGGTQANKIMIDTMLRPYEAVLACDSGHINSHESGSIESTGHRIETVKGIDGKVTAQEVEEMAKIHVEENVTVIKAVYISNCTEIGTIYTKAELQALREVCDKYGYYLYMDGARLGAALTCKENDLTMADLVKLCDVFYIGATKNGGMLGEALVIVNDELNPHYRNVMKQNGAMLAKGFVLGAQYDALFTDDLFFKIGKHDNDMAMKLKEGLLAKGIKLWVDSPSNQQFPIMTNKEIERLEEFVAFEYWEKGEEESIIRFVCSWAITPEQVDYLLSVI